MNTALPVLNALALAAPWCAGVALMIAGAFLVLVRGRAPAEKPLRPTRLALPERLAELGFRGSGTRWEGTVWDRPVRVALIHDPNGASIEISTPVQDAGTLHVHIGDGEVSLQDVGPHKIGDPAFDKWFDVAGSPEELALLTAAVRRGIRHVALDTRPNIERGVASIIAPANVEINERLMILVSIVTALESAALVPAPKRLHRMATSDPEAGVRLRFLEILGGRLEGAALQDLARAAAEDPALSVRTQAAVLLADPVRLLQVAQDEEANYRDRRKAGRALLERGTDRDKLEAAVALARGPVKVHGVAMELAIAAGASGLPVDAVFDALTQSPNGEVARDAAVRLRSGPGGRRPSSPRSSSSLGAPRLRGPLDDLSPPPPSGGDDQTMVRLPPPFGTKRKP